jgi:hypothetical protein
MTEREHYEFLTGPPEWVQRQVEQRWRTGKLLGVTQARPDPEGCRVRLRLAGPAPVQPARQTTPARRSAADPAAVWPRTTLLGQTRPVAARDWSPAVRPVLLAVGGLALLVGVLWLVVAAVTGAVRAATQNVPVLLLALIAAGIAGRLWLRWWLRNRGRSSGGSGGACSGLVQHCNGCSEHR